MSDTSPLHKLDERSREIFRRIVETYLETGESVGSRTLSQSGVELSPASIRNVMSDLASLGLLDSVHISSGRRPSQLGLRFFVDSLLEVGELADREQQAIKTRLQGVRADLPELLSEASDTLSGLTGGAGLVASPKHDGNIKQVQFVPIGTNQALCILVYDGGDVENRIIELPPGYNPTILIEASNFLTHRMSGHTLQDAIDGVSSELDQRRADLDLQAQKLIEQGLADWSGEDPRRGRSLIVRGQANLLQSANAAEDLERVQQLFSDIERQKALLELLDSTRDGAGARIFIGAESRLFSLSGSSLIVSPYISAERKVVGALGVIGPTHLDYARVIPMVDYTARVVGRILDKQK